jgi:hypothetical protein
MQDNDNSGPSNQVPITFFAGVAARAKREELRTLPSLAALIQANRAPVKARLPWLKFATFGDNRGPKGSLRHDANVIFVSGVELDYDAGVMSLEEAAQRLRDAGILALTYTSPSYRPDCPKWRAVCPFSQLLPPAERARMAARGNGVLGGVCAPESFVLSQAYFFGAVAGNPHHKVILAEGIPIDLHGELDAGAQGKTRGGAQGANGRDGPLDEAGLMAEIRSGKSYHPAARSLLGRWAFDQVPFATAAARITSLFDETPEAKRDRRWKERRGQLFRLLDWVYGREAEKQGPSPEGAEVIDLGLLKAELPKLAKLGGPEYEARRKAAAAQIKIATTRLDGLVKKERDTTAASDDLAGQAVAFQRDPRWPEEVELTDLLDAIDDVLQKTMVMSDAQRLGYGLWAVFSHAIDAFDTSPRIVFRSALMRSGKTKALRILRILAARGLSVAGISAAALFRAIAAFRPTLLLDESDLYLNDARKGAGAELNLALQALVNGGFDRDDAHIIRVEGERVRKPHLFSIWCALGLARIGVAASTIEDRSIVIRLTRKATTEKVARLDKALRAQLAALRRQAARFAADNIDALRQADPDLPEFGNDRASDSWRPLIAIADLGGKALGAQARAAALTLSTAQEAETQELELQALVDIRPWLEDHPELTEVFTSELVAHLHTLEDRGWSEFGRRQQPISQSQLARLLGRIDLRAAPVWRPAKPPATTRLSGRGYKREALEGLINRYLPPATAPKASHRHKRRKQRPKNGGCDGVTLWEPLQGLKTRKGDPCMKHRQAYLRSRFELERAAWGKRKQAIVHQEKLPTHREEPMSRYDRWQRIKVPEPPVYPPGSVWSRMLGVIASIEATGKIDTADMTELAEGFELRHTPEDADLSRFCRALSRAHTIK